MKILAIISRRAGRIRLAGISGLCLLYAIFRQRVAERHIQLPFLDFPIFVGEIVLGISLILLGIKLFCDYRRGEFKPRRWHLAVVGYIVWVLVMAVLGYREWGPFALRNAALFYYALFAVVTYYFYQKEFFTEKIILLLLLFMALLMVRNFITLYYGLPYLFLFLVLLFSSQKRWVRVVGIAFLLLIAFQRFPYLVFLHRSHLVGVVAALGFLAVYLCYIKGKGKFRIWTKLMVSLFFIGILVFIYRSMDKSVVKSLTLVGLVLEEYKIYDAFVGHKRRDYVFIPRQPQLYQDNNIKYRRKDQLARLANPDSKESVKPAVSKSEESVSPGISEGEGSGRPAVSKGEESISPGIPEGEKAVGESMPVPEPTAVKAVTQETKIISPDHPAQPAKASPPHRPSKDTQVRGFETTVNQLLFRLFIWRDMLRDLGGWRTLWGVGFGYPQRSKTVEIIGWARDEWSRDGWITPHNSFLHMIYRGGVVGLTYVVGIGVGIAFLTKNFLRYKSFRGGLLVAALVYWLTISNFLVFLELPHTAIPFWSLFGLTFAYFRQNILTVRPSS